MLKRAFSFVLCLMMLVSLCGCGEKEQTPSTKDDSAANVYLETAQMFVSKGDYASAIDTLEEGIKKTNSDKLTSYLQSVKEMQANSGGSKDPTTNSTTNSTQPSKPTVITDYNYYLTNWVSPEGFSFESTGVALSISLEYEWVQFDLVAVNDGYFINRLIASCSPKEFRNPTHSLDAGNEMGSTIATLNIEFSDECVILTISDLITQDQSDPFKKFQDKAIVLTKDDDLYEEEIPDEPVEEPDNTPVYDLSKASGILKYYGLTESEFRSRCIRLESCPIQDDKPDCTDLCTYKLFKYPNRYVDNFFMLDGVTSEGFYCTDKGVSSDGYIYYEWDSNYRGTLVVYDFRDDVYSPNIQEGESFKPYVIFKGLRTTNYGEYLVFWMISVDMDID